MSQRVLELEKELDSLRQQPSYRILESQLKCYKEEIQRLQSKIMVLQTQQERNEKPQYKNTGDGIVIQSLKMTNTELHRKIEKLEFEKRLLINSQEAAETELRTIIKQRENDKNERTQIYNQIKELTNNVPKNIPNQL